MTREELKVFIDANCGQSGDGTALLAALDKANLVIVPRDPTDKMLKYAFAKMNELPSGSWKSMKGKGPRELFDIKMRMRWIDLLKSYLT